MKLYGFCNLGIVPVRKETSHKSEMVTQLLFGDHFEILENTGAWIRLRTGYDDYEGWIDHKQFEEIDKETFVKFHDLHNLFGLQPVHVIKRCDNGQVINLVAGSNIPDLDGDTFIINAASYEVSNYPIKPDSDKFDRDLEQTALFYLNTPYLWGGKSLFGIDCSGFCQMVYKQFGIRLNRDAAQQAEQGDVVDFLQEAILGDLAFFDNEEGHIIHVGIMLNNSEIIHASGRVKIEKIDNQGIYSEELQRYTHKLRIIKRIV